MDISNSLRRVWTEIDYFAKNEDMDSAKRKAALDHIIAGCQERLKSITVQAESFADIGPSQPDDDEAQPEVAAIGRGEREPDPEIPPADED